MGWSIETVSDVVVLVRMDSNKVNVMNNDFLNTMMSTLDTIEKEHPTKGIVLTGNSRAFSAGLDLSIMEDITQEAMYQYILYVEKVIWRLFRYPRPVVAAINGHCIAGGMLLAAACDYRVSVSRGTMGMNEVPNGIAFPFAMMQIMRHTLGNKVANRILLGGELFPLHEAADVKMGRFVDDLVDNKETLIQSSIRRASLKSYESILAYAATKELLRRPIVEYVENNPNETMRILKQHFHKILLHRRNSKL